MMKRKFRGHRKIIGAMPGRIISEFKKEKIRPTRFVLDEMTRQARLYGDPSSAFGSSSRPGQKSGVL